MNPEGWIPEQLARERRLHRERTLTIYPEAGGILRDIGHRTLNLSSNDYLNLIHHPALIQAGSEGLSSYGSGAGASRLVSGTLPVHEELEAALATLKGYPAALVFGSGYLTNIGVVTACAGREDAIFADRLVHASLIDAAVLSRATLNRFRHNDPGHLAELLQRHNGKGRKLVLTESVFSMDGDLAPLAALAEVCRDHDALFLVDEAHASGVFGPNGAGRVLEAGLESAVQLSAGTLSKALGGYGGFVACSNAMRQWLINKARPFIYSTALPPSVISTSLAALQVIQEHPPRGPEVLRRATRFRHRLQEEGLDTLASQSQIIPVLIGDDDRVLQVARRIKDAGILAVAIRPPTVPEGTARLRLSITYAHTDEDLTAAAEAIIKAIHAT